MAASHLLKSRSWRLNPNLTVVSVMLFVHSILNQLCNDSTVLSRLVTRTFEGRKRGNLYIFLPSLENSWKIDLIRDRW